MTETQGAEQQPVTPEQIVLLAQGRIMWILNDAAYKAPEQVVECWRERWEPHLRLLLRELHGEVE